MHLTASGRKLVEKSACLGETLLARAGMSLAEISALNRRIQTLRDALAAD